MTPPTRVRFTTASLGLVRGDDPRRFAEPTVGVGDEGDLVPEGDEPFSVPEGWRLVKVGDLYAPVHPSMFEAVER